MVRALAHPLSLLVLAFAFVLGVVLHGWVQALLAGRFGDRRPRLEGRTKPDPRNHLDPFGAVAVLLSGLGWGRGVELPMGLRRRTAQIVVALSGPLVNIVLGLSVLGLWGALFERGSGVRSFSLQTGPFYVLQNGATLSVDGLSTAVYLFGCVLLYLGVLCLVPLPPLDGGRLLFALGPRTAGWQKAEHQLVERNIGIVVLLALLLIPLGGPVPILPQVLDTILTPLVRLVTGG